jgi:O-antigen ligase
VSYAKGEPDSRGSHGWHVAALAFLTLFHLSLFGPLNGAENNQVPWGLKASILVLGVSLIFLRRSTLDSTDQWITLGASLLVLTFLASSMWRTQGLASLAPDTPVNAQGWGRDIAAAFFHDFLLYYAIFPCALLLAWRLIRHTGDKTPWLIFLCFVPSLLVAAFQYHIDNQFLLRWPGLGFSQGLSTDSNALGLVSFLLVGLLLGQASFIPPAERTRHMGAALLCALACLYSESRIANFGVWLLVFTFLLIHATARWGALKAVLGSATVLVLGAAIVLNHLEALYEATGGLGIKVKYTVQAIDSDGVLMAFMKEKRGDLFRVGWSLLWKAPYTGWGPGGFYIQFSNEWLNLTGNLREVWDSVTNHYLMIAIDFGIPAMLLYLSLMCLPLMQLARAWKARSGLEATGTLFLMVFLLIFFGMIMFVPPAYFPDTCWMLACTMAYALYKAQAQGAMASAIR